MAPATSKKRREKSTTATTAAAAAAATRRVVTRSIYKKQLLMSEEKPSKVECSSTVVEEPSRINKLYEYEDGCSTPKSEKYKIPEIMTCPPAPKKPRIAPSNINSCLNQRRRPISFFAHPDLDKFFMFAMRDHIKV